jgi:glycosyltransferase involved in cell wall biosynthesis
MKIIIISGISIVNAGALTILNLVAQHLSHSLYQDYRIIFIVHENLITTTLPDNIEILEIQKEKVKWLKRLYFEYFYFNKLSKQLKPYLWLSLHEITPFVKAEKRAVYCHHSHLFAKHKLKMFWYEPTILLFKIVFNLINKITLHQNDFIIVQQSWMRKGFAKKYNFPIDNIIVSPPESTSLRQISKSFPKIKQEITTFIYPVFPRSFKNFELICEAVKGLVDENIINFKVLFTFLGNENKYAAQLVNKYKNVEPIEFIGFQSHEAIKDLYGKVDAMIFASLIESWGLPISEFKVHDKPIICVNLPYAKETLGNYDKVLFFEATDIEQLKSHIKTILSKKLNAFFEKNEKVVISQPFAEDWKALFKLLLN